MGRLENVAEGEVDQRQLLSSCWQAKEQGWIWSARVDY
jgi:hypothetical protein